MNAPQGGARHWGRAPRVPPWEGPGTENAPRTLGEEESERLGSQAALPGCDAANPAPRGAGAPEPREEGGLGPAKPGTVPALAW